MYRKNIACLMLLGSPMVSAVGLRQRALPYDNERAQLIQNNKLQQDSLLAQATTATLPAMGAS